MILGRVTGNHHLLFVNWSPKRLRNLASRPHGGVKINVLNIEPHVGHGNRIIDDSCQSESNSNLRKKVARAATKVKIGTLALRFQIDLARVRQHRGWFRKAWCRVAQGLFQPLLRKFIVRVEVKRRAELRHCNYFIVTGESSVPALDVVVDKLLPRQFSRAAIAVWD